MKGIKMIFKIIVVLFTIVAIIVVGLSLGAKNRADNYYKYTKIGGNLDAKYTAMGNDKVSYKEYETKDDAVKKYAIWYPEKLESGDHKYPVVIFANGTGSKSNTYKSFLTHLASRGFISVGNDDENTRTGDSLNKTIEFLIAENENKDSMFYHKIDIENIGIGGHSQGGPAVFNMAGKQSHKEKIKAVYAVSPTSSYHTNIFKNGWEYDLSLVHVPVFMTAGTGAFDAGTANEKDIESDEKKGIMQGIAPLWSLEENFNNLPKDIDKIYARKKGIDHGDSYLQTDGYMTAWFMHWLQDDDEAGKVFFGENAEILTNGNWQDIIINSQD